MKFISIYIAFKSLVNRDWSNYF